MKGPLIDLYPHTLLCEKIVPLTDQHRFLLASACKRPCLVMVSLDPSDIFQEVQREYL